MALAYAPFEDPIAPKPPSAITVSQTFKGKVPVSDNTECNYIVMFFVAGVFLLGIADAMRSK
jgi:hypothetical protein